MFNILSLIFRYFFILLIYLFMFGIIRMIYLDIRGINKENIKTTTYLKLINRKDSLPFKVNESYSLNSNTTIGRSNKSNITIKDPFISKKHAKIVKEDNEYFIIDLDSANGTFVNEEQILDAVRLKNSDNIKIGNINFLFVKNE